MICGDRRGTQALAASQPSDTADRQQNILFCFHPLMIQRQTQTSPNIMADVLSFTFLN
jgi:hypothetical protein